jgi:hypothetical protein
MRALVDSLTDCEKLQKMLGCDFGTLDVEV